MGVVVIALALRFWYVLAIAGLLAALGVQQVRINHAQAKYARFETKVERDRADRAANALEATNENQRISNRWNAAALGAINESKLREQRLQTDAAGASAELDRLRVAIRKATSIRGDVPSGSSKASPEPANPVADVLRACAAEVQELAGFADAHASDVQTLTESWPK